MTSLKRIYCQEQGCMHYHRPVGPSNNPLHVCRAFPKGIPLEIQQGTETHLEPYPGDTGIVFQQDDGQSIVYLQAGKKAQGEQSKPAKQTVQKPAKKEGPGKDQVAEDSSTVESGDKQIKSADQERIETPEVEQLQGSVMFTWDESKHPRIPKGQAGGGQFAPKSMKQIAGSFARLPENMRVWQGKPHEEKGDKPSKLAVGEFGEEIAAQVLSEMKDSVFGSLNVNVNNMPIDIIGDHWAVEVKCGLATNGQKSTHWRATIGQPGKAEQAALKLMSPEEKRRANDFKEAKILERKHALLQTLSNVAQQPVAGKTMALIVSEDLQRADVFLFDGFHLSLRWSKYATEQYYVGTFVRKSAPVETETAPG